MSSNLPLVVVLAVLVVASAVASVFIEHLARALFVELQSLQREQDAMQVEWGQLELEQSTWAAHDRVAKAATGRLQLYMPPGDSVMLVSP